MKTRRSLDFDGLDGILQTQNTGDQTNKRANLLWWLLPLPIAVGAFLLTTNNSHIPSSENAAPTVQQSATQEPRAAVTDRSAEPQATEIEHRQANMDVKTEQANAEDRTAEQNKAIIGPNMPEQPQHLPKPNTDVIYTINFTLDSSKLNLMTPLEIEAVVNVAKQCPGKIQLTGHTCNLGNARVNSLLGMARAKRVKKLLANNGIDPKKIITLSNGMDNPVATNDTEAGRKSNRRVDLNCPDP